MTADNQKTMSEQKGGDIVFSKICSRVGRYSHTPVDHGKIHQAQRLMNTRSTRLAVLNKECIAALNKVEINDTLWDKMCAIEDKFRTDIHLEVESEYQRIPDDLLFSPDDSPAAVDRAIGHQLACGLSETPRFLLSYPVTTPGMTLEAAITPVHKINLVDSLNESFPKLLVSDQNAMASAIRPDVLIKLGLPVSRGGMKLSIANESAGKPQLTEDHLLALVDYCSSQSGMFNPINESMRLWQLCGVDRLALITSCLYAPFNEALGILAQHDAFFYRGPLYKGVIIHNGAGTFRLSRMQPGMMYQSPHWTSASQFETKNYAAIKPDRQLQLTILNAQGVRAHMFNDKTSIDQGEVIMPPYPLHFIKESQVNPALLNPDRQRHTIYCKMQPVPSGANARPTEPFAIRV